MNNFFLTIIIAAGILFSAYGQDYVPTKQDLDQFYKTKTLVVLDDNPLNEYNFIIQDLIKKEWTLTPYDFISLSEFETKRLDPQYSFLVTTLVGFELDKTKAKYKFLHLMLGGDYFRMNQMPDIVAVPLAYENVTEEYYIYKLATMVRLIQSHVKLITENTDLIRTKTFKYYKDNIGDIQKKTLYIVREELAKEVNSESLVKKVYPYKFKIVTREEVQEAIERRDKDVVFLHKVGPEGTKLYARCYKIVIGADEPTLYYFDYHMISDKKPDGFLAKDFEKLVKKSGLLLD